MKLTSFAVINFVYFLYNFPGSFPQVIDTIFPNDSHLLQKWHGIVTAKHPEQDFTSPADIIDFFILLDQGNQRCFAEWVENNYHWCLEHKNQLPQSLSGPYHKYAFTLKHDQGKVKITTSAETLSKAIFLVTEAESCPESAILKIDIK